MTYCFTSARRRRLAVLLSAGLVFSGFCTAVWADPAGPSPADHNVAVAVTWALSHEHLLHRVLDKEISQRCFKTFLRDLDPMKMYFYQSDIDAFSQSRDLLAAEAERGNISFAYLVFRTFLARVDERVKMIDELLAEQHDFTVDEEMVTDKDLATYAKTPAEARERWRKRIKFDLLLLKADKSDTKNDPFEGKTPQQRLTQRYHSFAKRMHQTSSDELLEMYLTSLTTALDPHTDYMSPDTVKDFDIMMGLKLEGIGASLQGVDGYTVVKRIIPGGAAEKEGHLKLEDKVLAVGRRGKRRVGQRRRHEAQRRGEADPRQAGHDRPPPGPPDARHRARRHDHRDRPGPRRSSCKDERQRQRRSLRRRPQGRRPAVQDRRDRPAQLLHGHGGGPARRRPTTRAPPATAPHPRRLQEQGRRRRRARSALQRRRLAQRGDQLDRPVHLRRAGRPGEGRRRPGHGLHRSATRPSPGRGRWSW